MATQFAAIAAAASLALLLQGCTEDLAAKKSISAPPSTMKVLKENYEEDKELVKWEYDKAKENAAHMEGKLAYEKDKKALKESVGGELEPYEEDVAPQRTSMRSKWRQ